MTTADKWHHCIVHIIKEEDNLWVLAYITDVVVDNLINNTTDSSDDSNSDTDMEGIESVSYTHLDVYKRQV